jgi:hypothetical protein
VKTAEESDDLVAAGGPAGQLDGPFHCLGPRIAERHAALYSAGRNPGQLFRQRHHPFVIEIRPGHVDQAGGLFLDGFHHAGMAMAGRHHGDPGVEIEKTIAVYILYHRTFAAIGH